MGVALLLPAPFELQKLCRKSSVGKTAHEVQNGGPVDLRIRNKSGKVRSGRRAFHRCLKHMKIEGLRPSKKRCFSLKSVQISLCPPLSKRHTEYHKNTSDNGAEIDFQCMPEVVEVVVPVWGSAGSSGGQGSPPFCWG